ncbi:uncharacterized protein LOC106664284 isoform X2 [Cimex lectularius]|uniref:Tetratricopeptide repeat protein 29 n=1 Tax=Cimex lectularius TaxID=79782 RepID=A0A8I6RNF8_CIMLE|nr:uncharacterized protein LOC106664284 isoform X2 [Cimex lectularius]
MRLLTKKEEWLLLELEEDGFTETLSIINSFIKIESEMQRAQAYFFDAKVLNRKPLSQCPDELEFLSKILKYREYYKIQGEVEKGFSLMLYLALHYEERDDTWLWIVYEIYLLALEGVTEFKSWDSNYCEAVIRYLFGRVLLERIKRLDEAYTQLFIAYELSLGKTWSTSCITSISEDFIHRNSAFLIYVIQLLRTEKWAYKDPQFALDCIKDGVQKIINTGTTQEIIEALMELALIYNKIHMPHKAVVILIDVVQNFKVTSPSENENLCNCFLYLAFCYRRMNMPRKAYEYLLMMLDTATLVGLKAHKAQALKHLGEYFLSKKMFKTARNYFRESKKIFHAINYAEQMEEVSILHGYTKTVIHFPDFCESIVHAVSPIDEDFARICYWMEYGTSFWKTKDPSSDVEIEVRPDEEVETEKVEQTEILPAIEESQISDMVRPVPSEQSEFSAEQETLEKKNTLKMSPYELQDLETNITNKAQGINIYLSFMNDCIAMPGNKEEAVDLSFILNCYLEDEHRYKIIEKIEELKFINEILMSPYEPPKCNIRQERRDKICVDAESSEEEDSADELEPAESSCKLSCLTIRPIMQMKDTKLPNKVYLIDVLNQQRMMCNENYLLAKLPKRRHILIPYSPNLVRLMNSYSSDEMDHLYVISPYKNLMTKICKDIREIEENFVPHSLWNESRYAYSPRKAGKVNKREVMDITPFYNIFKGKMESIKDRVIEKHNMLTEEAMKKKHKRMEDSLQLIVPKIHVEK